MIKRVDRYHDKVKERIKSLKKVYLLDNGFLQIEPQHSKNLGSALENWVFTILSKVNKPLSYLKDGKEIDFYCCDTRYQVSYVIDNEKTRKRELGAFGYFEKYGSYSCLITFDTNETIEGIEVLPIDLFVIDSES